MPGELPARANLASRPTRARTRCTACYRSSKRGKDGRGRGSCEDRRRLWRGDGLSRRRPAADHRRPRGGGSGAGAARRRRGQPTGAAHRAGRSPRADARDGRRPPRRAPPAPRPRRAGGRGGRTPGRHRDPRRPRSRLVPAGDRRPGRDRRRRAARPAADPAVLGLDAAALRPALARVVGPRRPRRPAHLRHLDRPRARRVGRAAQPAARDHAGAARPAVALHAVEQTVRHAARAARHRSRRLRPRRPRDPGGGRRAAARTDRRPHRLRPQLGGQARGHRAAVARRRPSRARRRPPRTWTCSPSSAPSPSATAVSGAAGPRSCGTRRRPRWRARPPSSPRASPTTPGCRARCSGSCGDVRAAAREVGVRVVHDLAVGCDPEGFDGWAWQDVLALGARVGAPPDAFSQQGQDWGLPPWRPDRLDATGYAAYRDLVRALLRQADGLRVDHVAGLFRLWWVPPGVGPAGGTYVHSDAEVMLAVLTLEAHRAGALVVGEDLGTVEPEVTEALHARGMLSSAVLWFTRDRDAPGEPLLAAGRVAGAGGGERVDARPADGHRVPARRARARPRRARAARRRRRRRGQGGGRAGRAGRAVARRGPGRGGRERGRAGHRHPRAARREPFAAGADRAVRRRRRRPASPTCPARSTSTRTGGSRCRCPSTSCARTRWWPAVVERLRRLR